MIKNAFLCSAVFFYSSFIFSQNFSQNIISTQGAVDYNNEMSLDWTLGETLVESVIINNSLFTQGFHQPELKIYNADSFIKSKENNVIIYPNPTSSILNVKFIKTNEDPVLIGLYDLHGRFIKDTTLMNSNIELNVNDLPNGFYLLKITDTNGLIIKTFKIIKS